MILKNTNYYNAFNNWIISLISLIFLIVMVGGLTRLTDSGLSITEWELFSGILPPISQTDWDLYFKKYKEIPQYYLLNEKMTLSEFKVIFYWEYIHRILARLIGIVFLIPLLFFIYKKVISKKIIFLLILVFFLICFQGFIGWYMVESGLTDNVSVSHFRLSIHLFIASLIFSSLIWILFNTNQKIYKNFFQFNKKYILIQFFVFLIFIQLVLGAFVSGLDAGKVYQTWPLMNGKYIPDEINFHILNNFNIFSDVGSVQFLHRNNAYLLLFIFLILGINIFINGNKKMKSSYLLLFIIIFAQIIIGILTLVNDINIFLASIHQISALILITFTLRFYFRYIN